MDRRDAGLQVSIIEGTLTKQQQFLSLVLDVFAEFGFQQ